MICKPSGEDRSYKKVAVNLLKLGEKTAELNLMIYKTFNDEECRIDTVKVFCTYCYQAAHMWVVSSNISRIKNEVDKRITIWIS